MRNPRYSVLSLFSGAGGLDIGFEAAGFNHVEVVDLNPWCIATLQKNRPGWNPLLMDVAKYQPVGIEHPDVLLAGVPCQGFSLGGNRDEEDVRNTLYKHVVRVAKIVQPRVVLIENVLNLRTMKSPRTGRPFADEICTALENIGYEVHYDIFKMCHFGVPQTRRRFVFVGFLGGAPTGYHLPQPAGLTTIREFLYDLAQGTVTDLPNHEPCWGFRSAVHVETGEKVTVAEQVVPVRFSRTASDGHPVRSFDAPFPAVDTATIWGWAQGNVQARRFHKDRSREKFIRNPNATLTLWRVSACRLRSFTHREYARLQTFPDDWEFVGGNQRDVHLQVGNAVPVEFARRLGDNLDSALRALDTGTTFDDGTLDDAVQGRLQL